MKKNRKNKKGFTLIEMLAAVVILGILAAIATIAIRRIIDNSRETTFFGSYDNVITGIRSDTMVGSVEIGTDTDEMKKAYNYSDSDYTITILDNGGTGKKVCPSDSTKWQKADGTCTTVAEDADYKSCNYYKITFESKKVVGKAGKNKNKPSYAEGNTGANENLKLTTYMDKDGVTKSALETTDGCRSGY